MEYSSSAALLCENPISGSVSLQTGCLVTYWKWWWKPKLLCFQSHTLNMTGLGMELHEHLYHLQFCMRLWENESVRRFIRLFVWKWNSKVVRSTITPLPVNDTNSPTCIHILPISCTVHMHTVYLLVIELLCWELLNWTEIDQLCETEKFPTSVNLWTKTCLSHFTDISPFLRTLSRFFALWPFNFFSIFHYPDVSGSLLLLLLWFLLNSYYLKTNSF